MTFFDETPDEPPRDARADLPPWFTAPVGQVPGLVSDRRTLARSGAVAVVLSHINAYPAGCELVLHLHLVLDPEANQEDQEELILDFFNTAQADRPDRPSITGRLQLGVELPGGKKALAQLRTPHDGEPDGPVLQWMKHEGGAGSGYSRADHPLWLWPLPPAEPFDLVVGWPRFAIPETRVNIDGAQVNDAANRSRDLTSDIRTEAS